MYGAIPAMISKDVLALVQLDPPGIELCRISNMRKEVEDEATGEEGSGTSGDRDRNRRSYQIISSPSHITSSTMTVTPEELEAAIRAANTSYTCGGRR
jgi:hypothetical protein